MLVYRRNGQQGGDCHMVFIHAPVRKDQDIRSFPVSLIHFHKQMLQHPVYGRAFIENNWDTGHLKAGFCHLFYF